MPHLILLEDGNYEISGEFGTVSLTAGRFILRLRRTWSGRRK
jgi:hypothetical protein